MLILYVATDLGHPVKWNRRINLHHNSGFFCSFFIVFGWKNLSNKNEIILGVLLNFQNTRLPCFIPMRYVWLHILAQTALFVLWLWCMHFFSHYNSLTVEIEISALFSFWNDLSINTQIYTMDIYMI